MSEGQDFGHVDEGYTAGGYYCPSCHIWVGWGQPHACGGGVEPSPMPDQYTEPVQVVHFGNDPEIVDLLKDIKGLLVEIKSSQEKIRGWMEDIEEIRIGR